MDKTIKQIADELKIDKQRVYRYIKSNHITASSEVKQSKLYDEAVQRLIKSHFDSIMKQSERNGEPHQKYGNETLIEQLIKELEVKNSQIRMLQEENKKLTDTIGDVSAALKASQESVKAAQLLQANAEIERHRIEQKPENFWHRIFKGGKDHG